MLTKEQITYFQTFGFLLLRRLFSAAEMETIIREAESLWQTELGRRPTDSDVLDVSPFVEMRPRLTQLIEDDRIYDPMKQLLGEGFIWSGSEGNRGVPANQDAHHWHADRNGAKELNYKRIKIMIYLDPMRRDEGAFRVIPGSHQLPLHEDLAPFQAAHVKEAPTFFGMAGADVPCCALETDPGDVVLFNQSLFHAVYGKLSSRRYIALKFAARPKNDEDIASLNKRSQYAFEPHESLRNSQSPRLRGIVDGLMELKP